MDTGNISGLTLLSIKVTSSRESDMGMGFGKMTIRHIRVITDSIKKKVLGFTYGKISKYTKESSKTIFVRVTVNFIVWSTGVRN
jgi:hypothetical protein